MGMPMETAGSQAALGTAGQDRTLPLHPALQEFVDKVREPLWPMRRAICLRQPSPVEAHGLAAVIRQCLRRPAQCLQRTSGAGKPR
jgi:hypothetical protein